ncbi:MAG TPA: glycosyltransferase family 4 protein [Gemmatimonadota bacterium]|nr:glycosyltransferase family 4 protein [Gemmatimonadota bacterium]
MRILHVVTAWPRDPQDVITPWLVTLTEKQAERGHEVDVLAPAWRGKPGAEARGVSVRRFRYAPARFERLTHEETVPDRLQRHPRYATLVPGYLAAGVSAAWRLGRRRRYDVVHVHWAVPHGLAGWAASRGAGAGLVTTFYGAEIRWAEKRFPPARPFLRWYCARSALVAISESTREMIAAYARGRPIRVIPYGVPLPEEGPAGDTHAGVRAGDASAEAPRILFVGRLVARKGVDRLLEALAEIEASPWRLEVVGFGPERGPLESRAAALGISDRVDFLGRVTTEELVAAYRRAACFVLPATLDEREDTEGLGVVLLEAMSYGVPVVATRRGGIVDIVEDGRTGLLVEDEPEALARAIAALLSDPARRRTLGDAGRARVRERFGWDSIVDRLDAVYASATERA